MTGQLLILFFAGFMGAIILGVGRASCAIIRARGALSQSQTIDDSFLDEPIEWPELSPAGLFDLDSNYIEMIHKQEEMERIKQATAIGVYTLNYGRGMVLGHQQYASASASCASVASSLDNLAATFDSHFPPRKPRVKCDGPTTRSRVQTKWFGVAVDGCVPTR